MRGHRIAPWAPNTPMLQRFRVPWRWRSSTRWLLLYSFSILVRYEPRRRAQLLDLDNSEAGVLIEYALKEALTVIPHLVLEAFEMEPILLAKPVAL